ncbi:class I SAM-dependent DNA methyltransferase [Litchfieldia salsa]|uniref:Methyltransferase domain-containing protein n=1 Tax=Litchfieldia salsa TaxID=930152 RepID=A0A1H0V945_9BACI|nr:class I SAM-dependent methyltransferase [Litchfieldia salsa]SDP74738.1 Methyltransferase domain-containing protein [Litchfieldia salsa]
MSYERFAYLYDRLMEDVPYEKWLDFLQKKIEQYSHRKMDIILDLACGTGEISVPLSQLGFQVVAIDLSDDMLSVANEKAAEANQQIMFYQQNMTELEGLPQFDVIVIFCDSLNYLSTSEEVIKTFQHVKKYLKEDGLFLFDVHSIYKMNHLFLNQTYVGTEDDVSFIWNCFPGSAEHSVEHELSFFVLDEETSMYERFDEVHYQRTFPIEEYEKWLTDLGFEVLEINGDFDQHVTNESERIFYTAKKGS